MTSGHTCLRNIKGADTSIEYPAIITGIKMIVRDSRQPADITRTAIGAHITACGPLPGRSAPVVVESIGITRINTGRAVLEMKIAIGRVNKEWIGRDISNAVGIIRDTAVGRNYGII